MIDLPNLKSNHDSSSFNQLSGCPIVKPLRRLLSQTVLFLTLPAREKWITLQIIRLVVMYPLLHPRRSMHELIRYYDSPGCNRLGNVSPERLLYLVRGVLRLNIPPLTTNCVKQSIVMYYFLRSASQPVQLYFGIAKSEEHDLHGHAWITIDNQPFGEVDNPFDKFRVTLTFPVAAVKAASA